ncbi:MAG: hypothetical protein LBD13_02895, partial [Spirochaetaceae bacterium]|jgi:hypothetical protein|nr:hypothetical protein [Spirochaetaceae bacterium]
LCCQERYFWALSTSLYSLNEYARIGEYDTLAVQMWDSVYGLSRILIEKIKIGNKIDELLKKEFPLFLAEKNKKKDEIDKNIKLLLVNLYSNIFDFFFIIKNIRMKPL